MNVEICCGIAPVLDEHAAQRPVGAALAIMEDEPGFELVERAGTGEIGDEIGVDAPRSDRPRR